MAPTLCNCLRYRLLTAKANNNSHCITSTLSLSLYLSLSHSLSHSFHSCIVCHAYSRTAVFVLQIIMHLLSHSSSGIPPFPIHHSPHSLNSPQAEQYRRALVQVIHYLSCHHLFHRRLPHNLHQRRSIFLVDTPLRHPNYTSQVIPEAALCNI